MSTSRIPRKAKAPGKGGSSTGEGPPPHPLARAIEQLYAAGATPRLMIDARRADVVVPEFLRAKWAERLVIDLDAAYPLDLVYDDDGVHASLAFSGMVTRCTFAWPAIYRVLDRASGRGIVVPAHEPKPELPAELAFEGSPPVTEVVESKTSPPAAARASLSVVPPAEAPPAAPVSAAPVEAPAPAASGVTDDEAKARRAKFRVIEGG